MPKLILNLHLNKYFVKKNNEKLSKKCLLLAINSKYSLYQIMNNSTIII